MQPVRRLGAVRPVAVAPAEGPAGALVSRLSPPDSSHLPGATGQGASGFPSRRLEVSSRRASLSQAVAAAPAAVGAGRSSRCRPSVAAPAAAAPAPTPLVLVAACFRILALFCPLSTAGRLRPLAPRSRLRGLRCRHFLRALFCGPSPRRHRRFPRGRPPPRPRARGLPRGQARRCRRRRPLLDRRLSKRARRRRRRRRTRRGHLCLPLGRPARRARSRSPRSLLRPRRLPSWFPSPLSSRRCV